MVHEDAERGKASILAYGLAEYEKEIQAIEECTHEIMVRSDQHAQGSDDESKKKRIPPKRKTCERSDANFLLCRKCFRRYVGTYVLITVTQNIGFQNN